MGSFGNYLGATLGTSTNEDGQSGSIYDNSWVTNPNYPKRAALAPDGQHMVQLTDPSAPPDAGPGKYTPNSKLLGQVPGLLSDHSTYQQVEQSLHGPQALNWESRTFNDMRTEKDALKPDQINAQATAWKDHGNTLKTESEAFKKSVGDAIAGHWSGQAADAADAASKQVTKSSIYDFTPSSEALANRLTVLHDAFTSIRSRFPNDANDQLIDGGDFNKDKLDQRIRQFNSEYHLDGGGHLRNSSGGYVTAADALKEMDQINRSIRDYQLAVQLFRDTYNPTVEAVTNDFPNLPAPPDMTYGQPTPGPGAPGPGAPFTGTPNVGPPGGGTPSYRTPSYGTPSFRAPSYGTLGTSTPNPSVTTPAPCTCGSPAMCGCPSDTTGANTGGQPTGAGQNGQTPATSALTNPTQAAGATGLASDAANGANQSLGSAMGAAQPAASGLSNSIAKTPNLPEGALRLAKGGPGSGAGGGGTKGGAAGGAGLGGLPKEPSSRLGLAAATPHAEGAETAAGSRAGVGAATPAAGAPGAPGAAGHGAGGAHGNEHKASKALRSRRNGAEIAGEVEAVVAVIGKD